MLVTQATIMNPEHSSRFPLQVTINALFITLSVFLGALLSIQNDNKTSDILLTSAHQVYDQLTDELILDIKGTYTPVSYTHLTLPTTDVVCGWGGGGSGV